MTVKKKVGRPKKIQNTEDFKFQFSWEYVVENRDKDDIVRCPFGYVDEYHQKILERNGIILEELKSDYRGKIYQCHQLSH